MESQPVPQSPTLLEDHPAGARWIVIPQSQVSTGPIGKVLSRQAVALAVLGRPPEPRKQLPVLLMSWSGAGGAGSFPGWTTELHAQVCAGHLPRRHITGGGPRRPLLALLKANCYLRPQVKQPLHRGLSRPLGRGQALAIPLEAALLLPPALTPPGSTGGRSRLPSQSR